MQRFLYLLVFLLLTGLVTARDWNGFRGLDAQGWAPGATPPSSWGPSENVLWSIPVPGKGHSSPIVQDNTVYVTSAYETNRFKMLLRRLDIAGLFAGCLALIAGLILARFLRSNTDGNIGVRAKMIRSWICPVLLTALVFLVVGLIWTVDRWFDPEENAMRTWKVHAGIIVLGLSAAALCFSFVSKWWFAIAATTPSIGAILYTARPDKREVFEFGSLSGTINDLIPFVPIVVGLILVLLWFVFRRGFPSHKSTWLSFGVVTILFALVGTKFGTVHFLRSSSELFRAVHAIDLKDGTLRWSCETLPGRQDRVYHLNSPATPTPVMGGDHIFAYFGSAGLVCADKNGKEQWTRRDLPSDCRFTHASSPVLLDGVLIVTRDLEKTDGQRFDTNFIVSGLSPETGKTLWEESFSFPETFASYSTATVHAENGKSLLWVRSWREILALEPRTGTVKWRHSLPYDGDHLVASPVIDGNYIYLMGGSEVICLDRNKKAILWRKPIKGEASASPLLAKGRLFVVTERSYASCYDPVSGELLWENRFRGKFFSSVIGAGDTVYFSNERGIVYSVANAPEFRQIGEHNLGEKIYASSTPVGDQLLIRTDERLFCFGQDSSKRELDDAISSLR